MQIDIVLVHPEIPQNTGNVARTCAALGARLHLVHPLGFSIDERSVRRAGLDYWDLLDVREYQTLSAFVAAHENRLIVRFSSFGNVVYAEVDYTDSPMLLFGGESAGLPDEFMRADLGAIARIPTIGEARCLNLSNSVAVVAYEAARQTGFAGLELRREPRRGQTATKRATAAPAGTSQETNGTEVQR